MSSSSSEGGGEGVFHVKEEWRVMEEVNKVCETLKLMIKAAAYDSISDMSGLNDSELVKFVREVIDHEKKTNQAIEEYTCKMIEEFAKRGIGPIPKDFISILGYPFVTYFRGRVTFSFATKEIADKLLDGIKPYLEKLHNEGAIKSTEDGKKEMGQTQ
jgi:hypothetical protein